MAPTATNSYHLAFRMFFLYIEPASVVLGAYYAALGQQAYLDYTHAPSSPQLGIPTSTTIVLNQLANLYLFFAINEALVLRATDDIRVWCSLLTGLLIADFGHLYSVSPLGSSIYRDVSNWNPIDWGNIAFVYAGAAMRIAFLGNAWMGNRSSNKQRRSPGKKLKPR